MEGVTLQDVWQTRMLIEPASAALLTNQSSRTAIEKLEDNVSAAGESLDNPVECARLTNAFSLLLTQYCGNKTIHILSTLIQDIVARQHVEVTVKTYTRQGVDRMREWNVKGREKMAELVRGGDAAAAEAFWRKHLEVSGDIVFSTYRAQMPIDVVQLPPAKEG